MSMTAEAADIFTRKEASEYLTKRWKQRVSPQTLATYASRNEGPRYTKTAKTTGGDVFYSRDDLDRWAADRLRPGLT